MFAPIGARAALCALLVSAAPALAQTTVVLQQGLNAYGGSADDWINCCSGADINRGSQDSVDMRSTSDYGLYRFAIFQSEGGPVPDGSTITSATLSLYKAFGPAVTYQASRLLK